VNNKPEDLTSWFTDESLSLFSQPPPQADEKKEAVARDLETYPEAIQQETMRRLDFLNWIKKRLVGGWTQKNLEPIIPLAATALNFKAPGWRTVSRWWGLYSASEFNLQSLTPKHHRKGNVNKRVSTADNKYIEEAISCYLVKERPTIAAAYQYYSDRVRTDNIGLVSGEAKALSYKGFYNRIKNLPPYDVMVARYGKRRADIEFNAVDGHKTLSRVMQRVEIDHTPLDLILLDDELNIPLDRAYLTILIDCYSRCIVGFHLGFNEPSYYSVRKALLNAIKPKSYIKEQYPEIENDWPCCGKIETLVVDNGREFWSNSIAQSCQEMGINIQFNPSKKPWLKPMVERIFSTINTKLIVSFPGKTFSNILAKLDYDPSKDAIIRFSTFNLIFHKWIVDVYHQDSDTRRTLIPAELWREGYDKLPPVMLNSLELDKLDVVLGNTDRRKHGRTGIRIHSMRYDCEKLSLYRKQYGGSGKDKKTLLVKTNPDDISSIHVYLDEDLEYLQVPCVDPNGYTKGLSLLRHRMNLHLQRNYIDSKVDQDSLAQARMYIHDRVVQEITDIQASSTNRKLKGASKFAKYQGVGSDGIGTIVPAELPSNESNKLGKRANELPNNDDWDDLVSDLEAY